MAMISIAGVHATEHDPSGSDTAATMNAAYALRREKSIGSLEVGKQADIAVFEVADYREIPYYFGVDRCWMTVKRGRVIHAPNKPQSNYSKRPVRGVRLLKISPRTTKSLFEEYFYGFVVMVSLAVTILGKAAGLSGYEECNRYRTVGGRIHVVRLAGEALPERASKSRLGEKSRRAVQAPPQMMKQPLPPNMKPMIGPQWPLKTLPGSAKVCKKARQASNRANEARANASSGRTSSGDTKQSE